MFFNIVLLRQAAFSGKAYFLKIGACGGPTNNNTDNDIKNVENTDKVENTENVEKKIIALAFQGEKFSSKFLLCWTNTLTVLWQTGKYEFLVACGDNPSIYHSRLRTLGLLSLIHISEPTRPY